MVRPKLTRVLLLALLGAVGLWLAWPTRPVTPLIFAGLVPFLLIEDVFYRDPKASGRLYIGVMYIGLLLWNAFTTYWVMKATVGGGLMAIVANSALMTLPFVLFHWLRQRLKWPWVAAFTGLITSWLSLELLHLNWQLAWPWLNLGNCFATRPDWVQWYEYTGALGGSLWILLVNGLLFQLLSAALPGLNGEKRPSAALSGTFLLMVLAGPLILSALIPTKENYPDKVNVVAVQPNVDPYEDKFNKSAYDRQLTNLLTLSDSALSQQTSLVLWPETSLPGSYQEESFLRQPRIRRVMRFLDSHPQTALLTGLNSYEVYKRPRTPTARSGSNGRYYDVFNAAAALDTTYEPVFYHKSKLVPGVEQMPYPSALGFLESLAIEMGGTSGSLGSQEAASVIHLSNDLTIAPVICYESVFGDYVGDYIQEGANLITVITNDGWWGDTDGYRQHFAYSVLRAIEMRRSIARSANTGISGFIRPDGEVVKKTEYWKAGTISCSVPLKKEVTFYAAYGDYLGHLSTGVVMIILGLAGWQRFRNSSKS